jgi:hypothetical protein
LNHRQQHFAINVTIGVVIAAGLLPLERNAAVRKASDSLLRWQVAQFANSDIGQDIVWIDIDDQTYLAWHAPSITPRDKLCRLIDFAVRGEARVVVVDINLAEQSPFSDRAVSCDSRAAATIVPRSPDAVLSSYLHRYASDCSHTRGRCPFLILTRSSRESYQSVYMNGASGRAIRSTFVDAVPFASSFVTWGTADWELDDQGEIHNWRLWEPLCDPDFAAPSVELLAAWAYQGRDVPRLVRELNRTYRPSCIPRQGPARHRLSSGRQVEGLRDQSVTLPVITGGESRRFFYRIGWDRHANRARMSTISARAIADTGGSFEPTLIRDRIVVIGGSYLDNPDFHPTPLGSIPGTLLLINAINSILVDDRVNAPSIFVSPLIEALLVLLVSAFFLYFRPILAMWAGIGSVVIATLTLGFYFLNSGFWADPVIPLLGILCKEGISQIEAAAKKIPQTT